MVEQLYSGVYISDHFKQGCFFIKIYIYIWLLWGKCVVLICFWSNLGRQNPHFRREGGFHRSKAQRRAIFVNVYLGNLYIF